MIIFPLYSDWALLILRVALASIFLVHGLPKLRSWKATTAWFQSVGFKPGWLWGTAAGILEVFGGLAILLGIQTRLVAMVFILQFLVILIWRIYRRDKFVGGWELDLLILASLLALLTIGGGAYSLGRGAFMGF